MQRKLEEQAEERKRQKDEHSAEEEKQLQEVGVLANAYCIIPIDVYEFLFLIVMEMSWVQSV